MLPPSTGAWLERFGRLQWSGDAWTEPDTARWMQNLLVVSHQDRDGFVGAIVAESFTRGGWALYGGERIVGEMLGWYPSVSEPSFLRLLDASIAFILKQGADGQARLARYHHDRLAEISRAAGG